jgi:superfamily II DNA or RNA helicase
MVASFPLRPARAWSTTLRRCFDRVIVMRGEGYVSGVRISAGDATRVVAKVNGSKPYTVVLSKKGSSVGAWCTCPHCSEQLNLCKHVWATLRRAEQANLLSAAPRPEVVELDPDVTLPAGQRGLARRPSPAQREESEEEEREFSDDAGYANAWEDDDSTEDEEDALDDGHLMSSRELLASIRGAAASSLRAENFSGAPVVGTASASWQELLAASRLVSEASRWDQPALTELRYLLVAAELGQRSAIYFAEIEAGGVAGGQLTLVPASSQARRLGHDAHVIEHALAGQRDRYGSPRLTAELSSGIFPDVVRELATTGRLHVGARRVARGAVVFDAAAEPLRWDEGPAWTLELELVRNGRPARNRRVEYRVDAWLVRQGERRPLRDALSLTSSGLAIFGNVAGRFDPAGMFEVVGAVFDARSPIVVAEEELEAFVREYYLAPSPPALTLPDGKRLAEVVRPLRPVLDLRRPAPGFSTVSAGLWFEYGEWRAAAAAPGDRVLDWAARSILLRDLESERRRTSELSELGFRGRALRDDAVGGERGAPITLAVKKLPAVVEALLERGWRVEAEGKPYRAAGAFKVKIKSGIDWFELDASLAFGDDVVRLPALLRALGKRERTVVLDDGSVGVLPEEWLSRWGVLGEVAGVAGENLRFFRSELPLLAAIAENTPEVDYDATFGRLVGELTRGEAPGPVEPPAGFVGELRGYQREGLGWLDWLERAGLGGCLADDMGLGKTVQVLAFLLRRRKGSVPSLVVAPRSVLTNWVTEAARFTPELRVHVHWGTDRNPAKHGFEGHDLVLTTYGTLCRDIEEMAKQQFRFVVLDEAQAVKNTDSRTARCVRALRSEHRLALTGTPVENHLGELFSLFDFLNPGMLARAKRVRRALTKPQLLDKSQAALLSRAVRPFILRRTKDQVARDLPARTEQTLYVDLSARERAKYDELLAFYRASLAKKVEDAGPERSAPHVLAALLRLRQAACHIGLLDQKRIDEGSAKLDVLFAQVEQVLEGGHKALIFSQFTSLLRIVRSTLEARGIAYAYLDGQTRDRAACVERFQNDDQCRLFLVSLKAGGVGLNLTAADYVFILDPWWNPAVEAQAIDRAHRIGQTKRVVAYRLLARDTVEEKVELLKQRKRDLVQSVLGGDAGFGGKLTREDLELLLG